MWYYFSIQRQPSSLQALRSLRAPGLTRGTCHSFHTCLIVSERTKFRRAQVPDVGKDVEQIEDKVENLARLDEGLAYFYRTTMQEYSVLGIMNAKDRFFENDFSHMSHKAIGREISRASPMSRWQGIIEPGRTAFRGLKGEFERTEARQPFTPSATHKIGD
ncbi:uncharacterized protein EI90DRAFT_3017897 [Cantharellus anzutake]|uniref:uncharacterized protein n=1 Tax=Cantharellus anzutake TaxID=1750568 RepID=UPI0019038151|nr:uncharacterized protein EI90DRAFT_3017897 [Cantharellus anzutake]KAF8327880.1 hypothetical protein EI90DRAFT_3017897 [Cantharellus anzutake]